MRHRLAVSFDHSVPGQAVSTSVTLVQQRDGQEELRQRAFDELRRALKEEAGWTKVHAAEALLSLRCDDGVRGDFELEFQRHGSDAEYRIGIWRILARAAENPEKRSEYVDKIIDSYWATDNPAPVHALESLAKLGYRIPIDDRHRWVDSQARLRRACLPYLYWLLAVSGDKTGLRMLGDLLDGCNLRARGLSAYALRHLAESPPKGSEVFWPKLVERLAKAAVVEPHSLDSAYLVSAAFVVTPSNDSEQTGRFRRCLHDYISSGNAAQKYEVLSALAVRGDQSDMPHAATLLDDPDADQRIAAAYAFLRIDRRSIVAQFPRHPQ
jgi:hypothetical protein